MDSRSAVESDRPVKLYNSKVIFRSGDPLLESELYKVGVDRARSIIVLSCDDSSPDESDSQTLRQCLSISGTLAAAPGEVPETAVAVEIQDVDNLNLISLINLNSKIIVSHDIVGQIMVSCSRQPGLAYLLERAVSFEDSEFYFKSWPQVKCVCGMEYEVDIKCV
jgi:hypothetical protein